MSTPRSEHICHGMERALCLDPIDNSIGPAYMAAHTPWMPAWGRGIYGGALIAQSLIAAQATVPADFDAHSLHSHFILPANPSHRIIYNVDRVLEGRSFQTRFVYATQEGNRIFTATISFTRKTNAASNTIEHANHRPVGMKPPPRELNGSMLLSASLEWGDSRPCDVVRCDASDGHESKLRHWIRARRPMGCGIPCHNAIDQEPETSKEAEGLHHVHAAAIAYMSDNYFIGTVARVHKASRFTDKRTLDRAFVGFQGTPQEKMERRKYLENLAQEEAQENRDYSEDGKIVTMMATLNHTIFFHNPRLFRADEWILSEMEAPWAGNERGLVTQRIWSVDGVLIATCIQEGVIRLDQTVDKSHL